MDNVDEVREAVVCHRAMFGTVDSWLIWVRNDFEPQTFIWVPNLETDCLFVVLTAVWQCLTGGKKGGVHCTDVTNASRTMLFNIHTMDWDPELCKYDNLFTSFTFTLLPLCRLLILNRKSRNDIFNHVIFALLIPGRYFGIPMEILPRVRSSSEIYGLMVSTHRSADILTHLDDFRFHYINFWPWWFHHCVSSVVLTECVSCNRPLIRWQFCFCVLVLS